MHRWIHEHDDRWSFILPYVALSVVLSVALSLFWLAALIVLHAVLEGIRHRALPAPARLLHTLARTQLDLALLLAAVVMEVYVETAAGLAGAGQFARGLGRILARLPGWQFVLRAVLLSSDDALQLIRLRKAGTTDESAPRLQKLPATIAVLATILLIAAPWILPINADDIPRIVGMAFRPLPG